MCQVKVSFKTINLAYLRLIGSIEFGHGHVLHVLVNVSLIKLDEVKAVVNDDPADPVILGLGAVVLLKAFQSERCWLLSHTP